MVSFSGIITFKKSGDLREVARALPLDLLMVETDAPYLAPVPKRGKQNRPGWVTLVGEGVAEARGEQLAVVATETWNNAENFYGLS